MISFDFFKYIWQEGLIRPAIYILDPSRRIFWGYLLTSFVIAIVFYIIIGKKNIKQSFLKIFSFDTWWSSSAIVDYCLFFIMGITKALFVIPYLYFGNVIAFNISYGLHQIFPLYNLNISSSLLVWFYPFILFLFQDYIVYLTHYAMHKVPWLWRIHRVHHSATTMTPFTLYRLHPLEVIINNFMGIMSFGIISGIFFFFSSGELFRAVIFGVNAFNFIFFVFGANLRHSNVPISFPHTLEKIFISPFQHQIHHDGCRENTNSNYGSHLALWDYLMGTIRYSRQVDRSSVRFGLGKSQTIKSDSLWDNLTSPFRK